MTLHRIAVPAVLVALAACAPGGAARPFPARPDEPHLRNVRQLTFGGENAEAYWADDGRGLIFQANHGGAHPCDQMYRMDANGGHLRRVSNGQGRTTCGYIFPGRGRILYSSTFATDTACPPRPDFSKGYVWALYDYQVYTADADGAHPVRITHAPGYNAEATLSPEGRTIVFTSVRNGDLDIYTMDADGGNVRQLTHELGYDGGPFFSPDGRHIVYRAYHPATDSAAADYRALLRQNLVRPTTLEIWTMDADGGNKRQVTHLDAASFAALLPAGRAADRLLLQLRRPARPRVRPVRGERRRHRPAAHHHRAGLRRVPHVQPGRPAPGLRLEPGRHGAGRDGHLRGRLGRLPRPDRGAVRAVRAPSIDRSLCARRAPATVGAGPYAPSTPDREVKQWCTSSGSSSRAAASWTWRSAS